MDTHEPESLEPSLRKLRPLSIVVGWGLAPAIIMIAGGLRAEVIGVDDAITHGMIDFAGNFGPVNQLLWSIWLIYPLKIDRVARVSLVLLVTFLSYYANIIIAAGGCAIFDPPFTMPH